MNPVLGTSVPVVRQALRSGERLCDLINAIRPGLVSRVTRVESERSKGVSAQKLEVKQLENALPISPLNSLYLPIPLLTPP